MASAMSPGPAARTLRGSGLDRVLPYLMLGPALFLVLGVIVYPLIDGLRSSTVFFRFGHEVRSVGLDNYRQAFADPVFLESLITTARFVVLAVTIETILGLALALLCAREVRFIRRIRTTLILPMIVTPVVVGIVFRLISTVSVPFSGSGGGGCDAHQGERPSEHGHHQRPRRSRNARTTPCMMGKGDPCKHECRNECRQ